MDHDLVHGGLARPVVAEDNSALAVGVLLEVWVSRGPVDGVGSGLGSATAILTSITGTEAGGRDLDVPDSLPFGACSRPRGLLVDRNHSIRRERMRTDRPPPEDVRISSASATHGLNQVILIDFDKQNFLLCVGHTGPVNASARLFYSS